MANNYTYMTPDRPLPCTEEEAKALRELLIDDDRTARDRDAPTPGLKLHWDMGAISLTHDVTANPEGLSDRTLKFVGQLIEKAGFDYWQFGQAFTCSSPRCGEFGGSYFRIYPDGEIWEAETVWTDRSRHWLISGRVPGSDEDTTEHVRADDEAEAMDQFIRDLYPDTELPDGLLDGDDYILEDPNTKEPWAFINSMFEICGPPIAHYV